MNKTKLLPFLALFAIIPLAFAFNESNDVPIETVSAPDSTTNYIYFIGHLSAVHKDAEGNVLGYYESDNVTVNAGENCLAKMLFATDAGTATGDGVCTGANTEGYRYIGLEESVTAAAEDDTDLNDPADEAGLSTPLKGSITWTNSTGTGASSKNTVVITETFTNSGASTETITGAALFNGTSLATRGMYAHALFGSSAAVGVTDTLAVTWTIETGGGTVP